MPDHSKQDHIDKMSHPSTWSNFMLPLVNRKTSKDPLGELGVLTGDGPVVHMINMYSSEEQNTMPLRRVETVPVKKYESYEKMYDDGWRVD